MSLPDPQDIDPPTELVEVAACPECEVVITPLHERGCPNRVEDPPFVWDCSRCDVQYAMSHQEDCPAAPSCDCCGE